MNRKELQIQKKNMLTVMQSCGYSVYSITKYSSAVSRFINYVSNNALNVDGYSIEEFIEYSCSIRKHNNPQYFKSYMRATLLSFVFFLENGYLRIGRPSNNPKISGGLAENINDFIGCELYQKQKLTLSTINDYKNLLKLFNNHFKENNIEKLSPETIYDFF